MKILLMTKYGDLAASTRQRFQQFYPYLSDAGFMIDHRPLLDNAYLTNLYSGSRSNIKYLFNRYIERIKCLIQSKDADLIWLHCDLFPYLPSIFERMINLPSRPIIFDYDDAIFHNYDLNSNPIIRFSLSKKLHSTISGATLVFCGNAYLAAYAQSLSHNVQIVPTVLDTKIFCPRSGERAGQDTSNQSLCDRLSRIGWIGTPSTWTEYMVPMMPLLGSVAETHRARLSAVGAGAAAAPHPLLDNLPWTEETEVACIQGMDVGIMPLADTPWARGKSGYKLLQYMACGLPVVASPVGVNAEIVEHGVNGFLASSDQEWREALGILLSDPKLRFRMGAEGRRKIEREYSLQVWGPRVAAMLQNVAERGRVP